MAARCRSNCSAGSFDSARGRAKWCSIRFPAAAQRWPWRKKLGRASRGFDLSPDYVKYGTERLEAIRVGDPLSGTVEPTMSAPVTVREIKRGKNTPNIDSKSSSRTKPRAKHANSRRCAR